MCSSDLGMVCKQGYPPQDVKHCPIGYSYPALTKLAGEIVKQTNYKYEEVYAIVCQMAEEKGEMPTKGAVLVAITQGQG